MRTWSSWATCVTFHVGEGPHFKPIAGKAYTGMPRGLVQLLWERGLCVDNMTRKGCAVDKRDFEGRWMALSMEEVMNAQPDVQNQKSFLALPIEARGHQCFRNA